MKKNFYRRLALLALSSFALSGNAMDLVVEESSGALNRYDLGAEPVLVCRNDSLVLTSKEGSAHFLLADVVKYYFKEADVSGVTDKLTAAQLITVRENVLGVKNGEAGTVVEVISASGSSVGRYVISADGTLEVSLECLPKGVYVIKTKLANIKIVR